MGSIDLPHKDSPDLHLVIARDDELLAQQHANSDEWRGALHLDAYLRRESLLFNQELTRDGGLTAWVLVYQPDSASQRQVLCGCESIKKRALVAKDGKVKDVICHAVASVFCPPNYRGRGYAGRMMAKLGKTLESWQADDGTESLFSVLYSDIGKEFYAARGWHPFESAHLALPASAAPAPEEMQLLKSQDLPELCKLDEEQLGKQMTSAKTDKKYVVALVPDVRILQWHHAREDFVSTELYGKRPSVKGVMVGDTPGSRVWAYFSRVWANPQEETPSTLHILRLVVEDEASSDFAAATPDRTAKLQESQVVRAIATILRVAQSEAAQWQMKEVSIWNPTSATLAAVQSIKPGAAIVHREMESIASLRWYGQDSSWKDVQWVCNEKYGWN